AAESKKEGYTVEWYTDEACTSAFDFDTAITADTVLYAKYTVIEFTVTFNHGGDIAAESKYVVYGGKVTAVESKKEGYTVEWYTDEACTAAFDFDTAITADTVLYAKYVKESKGGCGSDMGAGFYALLSLTGAALACALFVRRKKEDK
ncbi:MAG: InlB B-repeat-containing protein, partial [Candidatus Borkfalkiaceae bacterium]|nr:InlB B-repeat-containing protein [Christensenellaceae bacterium]